MENASKAFTILIILLALTNVVHSTENSPEQPQVLEVQSRKAPQLYRKGHFQSNSPNILEKIEVRWVYNSRSSISGGVSLGWNGLIYLISRSDFIAIDLAGNKIFNIYTNSRYGWVSPAPSIGKSGQVYLFPGIVQIQAFSPYGHSEWDIAIQLATAPPAIDNKENLYIGGAFEKTYDDLKTNNMRTKISKSGEIIHEWDLTYPVVRTPVLGQNGKIFCVLQDVFSSLSYLDYPAVFCLSPDGENWTAFLDDSTFNFG